ncbi:MAG TPA: hypothetical protein VE282_06250 [Gemmatimonadales bacterium]|jgi:hypothetical protein|nr:hypothetical protein [Gemmatimonadales bacterium]
MRNQLQWAAAFAIGVASIVPAGATTLVHMSLEKLVATNEMVVLGEALEAHSYWGPGASLILTDVRFAVSEVLKGERPEKELTITLPGGRVGDRTHVLVGTAVLEPGNSYVLFLDRVKLPGATPVLAIRDHVQGAFDVKLAKDGLRAVSQAAEHPLVPDAIGSMEPPGGKEGVRLETLIRSIREIERSGRQEVK